MVDAIERVDMMVKTGKRFVFNFEKSKV